MAAAPEVGTPLSSLAVRAALESMRLCRAALLLLWHLFSLMSQEPCRDGPVNPAS